MNLPQSLYLHVPFCRHRCGYCNFTLVAGRDHLIENYLKALEVEIRRAPAAALQTVFIGGGTPTHLPLDDFQRLLDIVESRFEILDDCEYSVEANPADITPDLIELLASRRVSRISLGVQSLNGQKLRFLERDHDREAVFKACEIIRSRIPNFSIDLIIGSYQEQMSDWIKDLDDCLQCRPLHVSTYSLTIEKGTQFWNRQNKNQPMEVDEELAIQLYEAGIEKLTSHGLEHYEISNFARPGFECLHNLNYWQGGEYFAFGPGAARYVGGIRSTNHPSTTRYIKYLLKDEDPAFESESIDPEQRAREILIFGLRQIQGINVHEFKSQTGWEILELVGEKYTRFLDDGFLTIEHDQLKLTRRGLLVSDNLWPDFL